MQTEYLSATALRITCELSKPPERVFDAWTKAEEIGRWFCPNPDVKMDVVEYDVRIGGHYMLHILMEDYEDYLEGRFVEIDRPRRLVFTWACRNSSVEKGESQVRVELEAAGQGTKLTLTHERLSGEKSRDNHAEGWAGCLTGLTEFVSG